MLSHGSGVSTHCHRPGDAGAWLMAQIAASALGRGLGQHQAPPSSAQVTPNPPGRVRAPFSPRGWLVLWGRGQKWGSG